MMLLRTDLKSRKIISDVGEESAHFTTGFRTTVFSSGSGLLLFRARRASDFRINYRRIIIVLSYVLILTKPCGPEVAIRMQKLSYNRDNMNVKHSKNRGEYYRFRFFSSDAPGSVKKKPNDSKSLIFMMGDFSSEEIAGVINRKNSRVNCS